jgi:hypothetical protein
VSHSPRRPCSPLQGAGTYCGLPAPLLQLLLSWLHGQRPPATVPPGPGLPGGLWGRAAASRQCRWMQALQPWEGAVAAGAAVVAAHLQRIAHGRSCSLVCHLRASLGEGVAGVCAVAAAGAAMLLGHLLLPHTGSCGCQQSWARPTAGRWQRHSLCCTLLQCGAVGRWASCRTCCWQAQSLCPRAPCACGSGCLLLFGRHLASWAGGLELQHLP